MDLNGETSVADNPTLEHFYRDVLGEFSTYKKNCVSVVHGVIPSPNLHQEVPSGSVPLDSSFMYKTSRPIPFLPPSDVNPAELKDGDLLDSVVQKKEQWDMKLKYLIGLARRGKKWSDQQNYGLHLNRVKKNDAHKPIYTVNTHIDVAEHLANDPVPFFDGKHNWLATGGSISNCIVNNKKYLLSSTGKNMDMLCVTGIGQEGAKVTCRNTPASTFKRLRNNQIIYQIVGSNEIAGIRQQSMCSVMRLKQGSAGTVTTRTLLEIEEKDGIFISMDMDPFEGSQFCTLDGGPFLKVWDLNTSSCKESAELKQPRDSIGDSWGFVKYSNSCNEIFVLKRKSVFVKDQRTPLSQNSMEFCPGPIVDDCEGISILLKSSSLPVVYVATSHHLLSLDLRVGWTRRWTHFLKAPPMFGSTYCDTMNSEECILLSSSIPDDTVAIVHTWEQDQVGSIDTFPVGLPSLGDCLLLARAHGKCLDPNLKRRLEASTCGLTALASGDGDAFTSLKLTCIGDVFSQQFLRKSGMYDDTSHMSLKDKISADIEAWGGWEDAHYHMCINNKPELLCPVICADTLFDCVKGPWKKDVKKSQIVAKFHKTFATWYPGNPLSDKKSYSDLLIQLSSYQDILAKVLLKAWDDEGLATEPDSRGYVAEWLGKMSYDAGSEDADLYVPFSRPPSPSSCDLNRSLDDNIFKVPATPASRPKKKLRSSIGF